MKDKIISAVAGVFIGGLIVYGYGLLDAGNNKEPGSKRGGFERSNYLTGTTNDGGQQRGAGRGNRTGTGEFVNQRTGSGQKVGTGSIDNNRGENRGIIEKIGSGSIDNNTRGERGENKGENKGENLQ